MSWVNLGHSLFCVAIFFGIFHSQSCFFPANSTLGLIHPGFRLSVVQPNPNDNIPASFRVNDIELVVNTVRGLDLNQILPNGTRYLLWSTNLSNLNCSLPTGCNLAYANDGNFLYHDAAGVGRWGTYTCGGCIGGAAYNAYLSTYPPYFSFYNQSCSRNWIPQNANARIGQPATHESTGFVRTQPLPLSFWYRSFGVCTHLSQGWNFNQTVTGVNYVGASTIRDGGSRMVAAGLAGLYLNLVTFGAANASMLDAAVRNYEQVYVNTSGKVFSVEGFNEVNNFNFVYEGIDPSVNNSYLGYSLAMQHLYSAVKSSPILGTSGANIPVYHLTGGDFGRDSVAVNLTDIAGQADAYNVHIYPGIGEPLVRTVVDNAIGSVDDWKRANMRVITEHGYFTLLSPTQNKGVDNMTQSKLIPNSLFNALYDGFIQTFIYELWDESWGDPTNPEEHFGIMNHDWTPKPAGMVLNRISTLLRDIQTMQDTRADPQLQPLNFSLSNLPKDTARYMLLQSLNNAGRTYPVYWIAVWLNIPVWNPTTNSSYTNAINSVQLDIGENYFGSLANITTYDVYNGVLPPASVVSSSYSTVVANTNSVTFNIADYVMLLKVEPLATAAPTPSPSNPPSVPSAPSAAVPTGSPPSLNPGVPSALAPSLTPGVPSAASPSLSPGMPTANSPSALGPTSEGAPTSEPPSNGPASNGLSPGAIAGIVVGVIAGIIILLAIVLAVYKFVIVKEGTERV